MCKVMAAVEERSYVVPTRITVREYLLKEWLPAIKGHRAADHLRQLCDPRRGPHRAGLGVAAALSSLQPKPSTPSTPGCWRTAASRAKVPSPPPPCRRVHATLHRALKDAVRWQRLSLNPADAADPPRGQSRQRELPAWNAEQLAGFLCSREGRSPLRPLAAAGDDRLPSWRGVGSSLGRPRPGGEHDYRFGGPSSLSAARCRSASRRRPVAGGGSPSIR